MHAYAQVRTGIYHSLTVCSCSFLSVCIQTLNTLQEEEDMFRDASMIATVSLLLYSCVPQGEQVCGETSR